MPIVWDNESTGTQRTSLQDFAPPLGYTVAKAVGATWADNPITRAYQWGGNLLQNDGEKLDAGAIDSLIKSAGVTDFTLPEGQYSKDAAMSLIERRRQQQIAADVDARTAWDYTYGTPIRALARTATMLADPLNMAAMFVPGLGEEWAAARVADGASQFTTRALQGASQGAAGMSALEAVNYPLAQQLHDDYKSTDSLTNILTGAVLGGALHGAFGRARAAEATPQPGELPAVKGAESPVPPDVAAVDEAAARTAVAQTVQDHPVSVDHLSAEALSGDPATVLERQRDDITANRERNILDGDGQPAREEPKAASEPEGRVQDAQARAMAAAQEAEATVRALQERMSGEPAGEVKSPVMEAADAQVAKADAQAKALTDIVNCQRVQ